MYLFAPGFPLYVAPHQIPDDAHLLIYGSGKGGRLLAAALSIDLGRRPDGFLDSEKGGTVDGFTVTPLDQLPPDRRAETVVLIASQYGFEIGRRLQNCRFRLVLNAFPVIQDMLQCLHATPDLVTNLGEEARRRDVAYMERTFPELAELGLQKTLEDLDLVYRHHLEWVTFNTAAGRYLAEAAQCLRLRHAFTHQHNRDTMGARMDQLSRQANCAWPDFAIDQQEPHGERPPRLDRGTRYQPHFEMFLTNRPGSRVLHIAPEFKIADWMERAHDSGTETDWLPAHYVTLGGVSRFAIPVQDLRALTLGDGTFDLVICHQVLEHILDDDPAIKEIWRVLARGGSFHVSVPASPSGETTEWHRPAPWLFDHVRQYSVPSFMAKLADVGFQVRWEDWFYIADKPA